MYSDTVTGYAGYAPVQRHSRKRSLHTNLLPKQCDSRISPTQHTAGPKWPIWGRQVQHRTAVVRALTWYVQRPRRWLCGVNMCQPHACFSSSPCRDTPDIWWDAGGTTKAETCPKASVSDARQKNFMIRRVQQAGNVQGARWWQVVQVSIDKRGTAVVKVVNWAYP